MMLIDKLAGKTS